MCWASAAHAEPETWSLAEALDVVENRCMTESELAANVRLWLGRPSVDRRIQIVVDQLDEDSLRFVLSREGQQILAADLAGFLPLPASLAAAERAKLD